MSESRQESPDAQYRTPVGDFFRLVSFISAPAHAAEPQSAVENQQERHEALPAVYACEGEPGRPVVLIALKNPGPMNFLMPTLQELRRRGCTVYLYATGVAETQLARATETAHAHIDGFSRTDSSVLDTIQPTVVIRTLGDAQNGGSALQDAHEQKYWRATFVDIEDFPGNGNRASVGSQISPEYMLVTDDESQQDAVARNRNLDAAHVPVTGRPDFDAYAHKDTATERTRARAQLREMGHDIPEENSVIVFSGQLAPAAETGLENFARHLKTVAATATKKITFIYSFHPRALTQPEQESFKIRAYQIFDELRAAGVDVQVVDQPAGDPRRPSADSLGYAADLFVNTHSTEGLASHHRGVPTMYVGFPKEGHEAHYDEAHPGGKEQLAIRSGSGFHIAEDASDADASQELDRALHDEDSRNAKVAQGKRTYKADGGAAVRVADAIELASKESIPADYEHL